MDLGKFQILLQKINSLNNSMSIDGNISKIEQDLMRTYVSQLYEACLSSEESLPTTKQETAKFEPKVEPPKAEEKAAIITTPPVVEKPPVVERVTEVIPPVVETAPVHTTPVVRTPTVEPVANYNQAANNQSQIESNHTNGSSNQPKTLNERMAEAQNKTSTTNDKFKQDTPKEKYTKPIIINVDHLKDVNSMHSQQAKSVQTPPPPPPPMPEPVKQEPVTNYTPPVVQQPVQSIPTPTSVPAASTIAAYFDLHNSKKVFEVSDRLGSAPITDLTKSIGLNDKISMIRELWSDDQFAFNNALGTLNSLGSFEEAKNFILNNYVASYNWDSPSKINRAKQFIDLIRRRYPN